MKKRRGAPAAGSSTGSTDHGGSRAGAPAPATLSRAGCAAVCLLAVAAAFANSVGGELVFDDQAAILRNPDINASSWTEFWAHDFWGTPLASNESHKSYRPLVTATYRVHWLLHGYEPFGSVPPASRSKE